jgi:hypothetical protein
MRERITLYPMLTSLVRPVQEIFLKAGGGIPYSDAEGGYQSLQTFWRSANVFLERKEKKVVYRQNLPMDLQDVNPLIRAADWVREKGQIRPISDVPEPEERIGILFNIMRRRRNLTLERLAKNTGYRMEELIAFEAGLLPRRRMLEMLPSLARKVGFAYNELLHKLQQNTNTASNL